jgi:hypothetical protein
MEENKAQEEQQNTEDQTAVNPSMEDEIFNNIFGQASGSDVFTQSDQKQEIVKNEEIVKDNSAEVVSSDPKNDEGQFQYWQSQADKRQTELDELKSKLSDIDDVLPIARHLKRNPDILDKIQEPSKETAKLERPVKPKKPAGYEHSEALEDPTSSSAKYLADREEYVDSMSDYMEDMDTRRQADLQSRTDAQSKLVQEQEMMRDLQYKYNYTPEEATDFMQTMSSPNSLSMDNLVKLHQLTTTKGQVTQVTTNEVSKQQRLSNRQEKMVIPRPIGVQPGASVQSPTRSTEDQIMDAMIDDFEKTNIF